MAYEIDVLVTYTEKDNAPPENNAQGWVTQFKKYLELMLLQVLGTKPNIVIKSELNTAMAPAVDNAAVLVTILTKEFAQSSRCLDLVDTFYKNVVESKTTRVFKVIKSPLSPQEQPPLLRESLGYEMYQLDDETGTLKEYYDFFGPEAEKQYWMKMIDLAYDIQEALLTLKEGDAKTEVRNIFRRKTIYLAETGHDLSVQRSIIKRELVRNGFVVVPTHTLSERAVDAERDIRKNMDECSLSIHLIGCAYGDVPAGTDRSIVDMQNKIAAEVALSKKKAKQDFSRLIWITQNLKNANDKQKAFIETLKRDTETQEGAEILENPLEDFKNIIRQELIETPDANVEEHGTKTIYLVHDRIDSANVQPFQDLIEQSGFKILSPTFEGDLLDVRKRHIENLCTFDGAIIFKWNVNDQWVRMKVLDLLKAPGFGRKKPIKGKAIIGTGNLDSFRDQNLTVISSDNNRSVETLKNFLSEL
ncbi:MAG: hypothetical protein ACKOC0_05440 [Cytophagales bacterium]